MSKKRNYSFEGKKKSSSYNKHFSPEVTEMLDFTKLTKDIWENIIEIRKKNKYPDIDICFLNKIAFNLENKDYICNNDNSPLYEAEYMFYFTLYHKFVYLLGKNPYKKKTLKNRNIYQYNKNKKEEKKKKEKLKDFPNKNDNYNIEPIAKFSPIKQKNEKREPTNEKIMNIIPSDSIKHFQPQSKKKSKGENRHFEGKVLPKLTLEEIQDKISNDPIYNLIIQYITKFIESDEALEQLSFVLKEDTFKIIKKIKKGKLKKNNFSFILYETDYYMLIMKITNTSDSFSLVKKYLHVLNI